tara:strand:- start:189 stop:350 length:162 start_codon:yes stop_codon:yes gene_type:complete
MRVNSINRKDRQLIRQFRERYADPKFIFNQKEYGDDVGYQKTKTERKEKRNNG